MRRKLVAGNWKLHGSRAFALDLVGAIATGLPAGIDTEVVILPPLPYLGELIEDFETTPLRFGAQDVSANEKGAFTGEVSAGMLVDIGDGEENGIAQFLIAAADMLCRVAYAFMRAFGDFDLERG